MNTKTKTSIETLAVHGGEPRRYEFDALTPPIVQTATYSFENTAELVSYMEGRKEREEYGRYGNPSVRVFEEKMAALEGAEDCVAFSSGMAALTSTLFALLRGSSHVVLFSDCYRRTRQFVMDTLARFGVTHTLVPPGDIDALEKAITPQTRLVISETPTNPYLSLVDLDRLSEVCRAKNVKTLIDATFATPINLLPLEHGIDLVTHSATKYLSGHNDVLAGVVAGNAGLVSLVKDMRSVLGAMCDPHAAYLATRGLKTLSLRVMHQNKTALTLARALEKHPRVRRVWYPGLESHPQYALGKKMMAGFGGVVTFELNGTGPEAGKFVDALKIPRIAPSLGGVESLVEQPALMSYFELTTEQREAIGISDSLVRYSVGIESAEDIVADVFRALG